ncbi:MAB_1171c family putative transporter [Lentzea sp. BCCO 10_0798]|uniref:MAB_1171c family putative transporter n=1 Tax=Lentzea kristufekii TaxID=3095430 RepID=A0ABU4TKE4_9PSEU|nr:MAB_1171c family putative transporter [Lentzea sp. BCCO 10_0798]MDX8048757.1 MAB_1171c family putative transporter [Lentzea sp. BCCO 10_0798]
MEYLKETQGIVAFSALAVVLYLLARRPSDPRLRSVTVLVAGWAIGYPFGRAAAGGRWFLGLDPMVCQLIQHSMLQIGVYGLICFFIFSALDDARARRQALLQLAPLVLCVSAMTWAVLAIPDDLRVAAARVPNSLGGGPTGVLAITVFYALGNGYLLYGFATMFVWARRYARGAEPRLRRGLLITSTGLALLVPADAIFVSSNVSRYFGEPLPRWLLTAAVWFLLPGVLLCVVGVIYPIAAMRLAATRLWLRHLRAYHRLAPLWMLLHQSFPEDALHRVPSRRDAFSLRGVHRRYYRRVIECRDGLVRISPYVAETPAELPLSERLRAGLETRRSGAVTMRRPIALAIPEDDGMDADVRELEKLAVALR